jgi:ELWxxDGT repeat protein
VLDGRLYFPGQVNNLDGMQIWEYDGQNPVRSVADVAPRFSDVTPQALTAFDGYVYYEGYTEDTSPIWRVDGSAQPEQPFPSEVTGKDITDAVVYDGALYYSGIELGALGANSVWWRYDGQSLPTVAFRDGNRLWHTPSDAYVAGGSMYFVAGEYKGDLRILWRYDGSGFPEKVVSNEFIGSFPTEPTGFTQGGSQTYFTGLDPDGVNQLWRFSGTSAPRLSSDLIGGASNPSSLGAADGNVYVRVGDEVWVVGVRDEQRSDTLEVLNADDFFSTGDALYFVGTDDVRGTEPWSIPEGDDPEFVVDVNRSSHRYPNGLAWIGETLYLTLNGPPNLVHYYSGGTVGTIDIPEERFGLVDETFGFTAWEGALRFLGVGSDPGTGEVRRYLFSFDETTSEMDAVVIGGADSPSYRDYPRELIEFDDRLWFAGYSSDGGFELWAWDGTTPPAEVADVIPGETSSRPEDFLIFDDALIFTTEFESAQFALWAYRPESGTELIQVLDRRVQPVVHESRLYFSSDGGLWEYGGSGDPVQVESAEDVAAAPRSLTSMATGLYFVSSEDTRLWRYAGDGGALHVDVDVEGVRGMTAFGAALCFEAVDPVYGTDLWCYDEVDQEATLYDVNPEGQSDPGNFAVRGQTLYFVAWTPRTGRELWSIALETVTGVDSPTLELPSYVRVSEAYPNPAGPLVNVNVDIERPQELHVSVFDVLGRRVLTYPKEPVVAGERWTVTLDLNGLARGLYFVRVSGDNVQVTRSVLKAR